MEEKAKAITVGDDGRVFVTYNIRPDEEIEWTEVFGEARQEIFEALDHVLGPYEDLPNQPMS